MRCFITLVVFSACGTQSGETSLTTLDQRASYLAATACDRYDACQGFSDERAFLTRDACEKEYKLRALNYWPSALCLAENIDDARLDACLKQVMTQRCANDFWEAVKAASECQPIKVCAVFGSAQGAGATP
jgi:hypothetical protein